MPALTTAGQAPYGSGIDWQGALYGAVIDDHEKDAYMAMYE